MRNRGFLILVGTLIIQACGAAAPATESTTPEPAPSVHDAQVVTLRPGRCERTPLNDGITRLDVAPYGWAYFVAGEFQLTCGPDQVVISQTGMSVVVRTIDPQQSEASAPELATAMLGAVANQSNGRDVQTTEVLSLGELGTPGRCAQFAFDGPGGTPLLMGVCVSWFERSDEQTHLVMVAGSDTEEAWRTQFGGDIPAFGSVVLGNFVPEPGTDGVGYAQ